MVSKPKPPSYSRPPVREAIIDIQIEPLPIEILPNLEKCGVQLKSRYPKIKSRYQDKIQMEFSDTNFVSKKDRIQFGYIFQSSDEKMWVQMRLDGFTFNLLKPDPHAPWPGWPYLKSEAKRAWEKFVKATGILEIKRLGVRYINQIVISGEDKIELEDYLTEPPRIPAGLPRDLQHFFSRIEVVNPNPRAVVIITQAPAPQPYQNQTTFTLDIDVVREQRISLKSFNLWKALDRFRDLKNSVFEASVKPKTKQLFGPGGVIK